MCSVEKDDWEINRIYIAPREFLGNGAARHDHNTPNDGGKIPKTPTSHSSGVVGYYEGPAACSCTAKRPVGSNCCLNEFPHLLLRFFLNLPVTF